MNTMHSGGHVLGSWGDIEKGKKEKHNSFFLFAPCYFRQRSYGITTGNKLHRQLYVGYSRREKEIKNLRLKRGRGKKYIAASVFGLGGERMEGV